MTELQPNTQITPETVGMLKAGDWLMPLDDRLGTIFDSGVVVQFVKASGDGLTLRVRAPRCGPHSWFSTDRFAFHRPAASSPSAVGVDAIDERTGHPSSYTSTPTPAAVDWTVVGPKLVEENERLTAMLRNVVAHATGGSVVNGETLNLNDICCRITQMRNSIFTAGKDAALAAAQPEGK